MKKYIAGGVILAAVAAFLIFTSRNSNSGTTAIQTDPSSASSSAPASSGSSSAGQTGFKDGTYTGTEFGAVYGPMQVAAVIQGGKLASVQLIQYPDDPGNTTVINQAALPKLVQEAIAAQSAQVDVVSGATQTSDAFQQSLASALSQAM